MTREEIKELKGLAASMGLYDDKYPCKRAVILGKAIKALEQEPCTDAISKQAVAEVLLKYAHSAEGKAFAEFLISQINDLPPVTPQYTDAEIQKMQDLEFAEIQKAYEIGKAENPNKWIPVSEGEYPEAYTEVLVYDNSDYFIAWWTGIRGRWDSYNSQFDINTPIVAWMPIEPYKASPTGAERSDKE